MHSEDQLLIFRRHKATLLVAGLTELAVLHSRCVAIGLASMHSSGACGADTVLTSSLTYLSYVHADRRGRLGSIQAVISS